MIQTGVPQGLPYRDIGIGVFDVLSDQGDGQTLFGFVHPVDHRRPIGHVPGVAGKAEGVQDDVSQARVLKHQGNFIYVVDGEQGNHGIQGDIAEGGDLLADGLRHRMVASAKNGVRLDPYGT